MKKFVLILIFSACSASAFEYKTEQWLFRGSLGNTVYFIADDTTQIAQNILASVELEYMLSQRWSIDGAFRPLFAKDRISLGFGVAAKYRFVSKELPIVPFISLGLTPAVLIPTNLYYTAHFNLGIRSSAGLEYL